MPEFVERRRGRNERDGYIFVLEDFHAAPGTRSSINLAMPHKPRNSGHPRRGDELSLRKHLKDHHSGFVDERCYIGGSTTPVALLPDIHMQETAAS